jgi:hypothetical protein
MAAQKIKLMQALISMDPLRLALYMECQGERISIELDLDIDAILERAKVHYLELISAQIKTFQILQCSNRC